MARVYRQPVSLVLKDYLCGWAGTSQSSLSRFARFRFSHLGGPLRYACHHPSAVAAHIGDPDSPMVRMARDVDHFLCDSPKGALTNDVARELQTSLGYLERQKDSFVMTANRLGRHPARRVLLRDQARLGGAISRADRALVQWRISVTTKSHDLLAIHNATNKVREAFVRLLNGVDRMGDLARLLFSGAAYELEKGAAFLRPSVRKAFRAGTYTALALLVAGGVKTFLTKPPSPTSSTIQV